MEKELLQEYVKNVQITKLSEIALIQQIYKTDNINSVVITEGLLQNVANYVRKNKNKAANIIKKSAPMAALLLLPLISQGQSVGDILNRSDAEKVVVSLSKSVGSDIKLDSSDKVYSLTDIKSMIQSQNDSTVYSTLGNLLKYSVADKDKINKIIGGDMTMGDDGKYFLGNMLTTSTPELKNVPKEDFYELGKSYLEGDIENGVFTFKGKKYKVDITPNQGLEGGDDATEGISFEEHVKKLDEFVRKVADTGSGNVQLFKMKSKGQSHLGITAETNFNFDVDGKFQNLDIFEFAEYMSSAGQGRFILRVLPEIYTSKYDKNGEYKVVKEIRVVFKK
jgi:hypothetical protein